MSGPRTTREEAARQLELDVSQMSIMGFVKNVIIYSKQPVYPGATDIYDTKLETASVHLEMTGDQWRKIKNQESRLEDFVKAKDERITYLERRVMELKEELRRARG